MRALQSLLEEKEELDGKLAAWQAEGEVRRVVAGHRARKLAGEGRRKRSELTLHSGPGRQEAEAELGRTQDGEVTALHNRDH